jgi:CubicO group peptidase (beta-lactamase class C family)
LLVSRDGTTLVERYGAGWDANSPLQGASLTELVVLALYGHQRLADPDLLDQPVGRLLSEWRGEPRGEITPRQLFWQLSGLKALPFSPFNPFSDRARLAFGPNFDRAALGFPSAYPPGSHFEATPANAQILGAVIARARGERLVELAERELWVPLGAGQATVALDRLAGDMAAHCCLAARARDWLRLARLLADDGRIGPRHLWPAGFVAEIAAASPVHPGYGLGVVVTRGSGGETLLWGQTAGRLLLAVPERHLAAVWFSEAELDGAARGQLLAALGL